MASAASSWGTPDISNRIRPGFLDLTAGDPGRLLGHEAIVAEGDRGPALGQAGHPAAHDLAVFDPTGHQHGYAPAAAVAAAGSRGACRSGMMSPREIQTLTPMRP